MYVMSELMEEWLDCVWERQPGALSKLANTLGMYAFSGHLSSGIRNR
jgi:hypothetical protein